MRLCLVKSPPEQLVTGLIDKVNIGIETTVDEDVRRRLPIVASTLDKSPVAFQNEVKAAAIRFERFHAAENLPLARGLTAFVSGGEHHLFVIAEEMDQGAGALQVEKAIDHALAVCPAVNDVAQDYDGVGRGRAQSIEREIEWIEAAVDIADCERAAYGCLRFTWRRTRFRDRPAVR